MQQEDNQNDKSAEELFDHALALHRQGDSEAACLVYQDVLTRIPEHAQCHFYLALLLHEKGRVDEAISHLGRAADLAPHIPQIHFQLGTLYTEQCDRAQAEQYFFKVLEIDPEHWQALFHLGSLSLARDDFAQAADYFSRASKLNPEEADCFYNLGLALKQLGKLSEAVQAYNRAIDLAPEDSDYYYNLGLVYKQLNDTPQAIEILEKAVALAPKAGHVYGHLAGLYLDESRVDEAKACYVKLIELEHNADSARHVLAALKGQTTRAAPASYVQELFDSFSGHFDERLVKDLEYRTPWELRRLLDEHVDTEQRFATMIDLGCGTGLSGEVFTDCAKEMIGVDLSPKMVKKAEAKNIYHKLVVGEIADFLKQHDTGVDLIVAADVFVYLGELEHIFTLFQANLLEYGKILFSTEHFSGEGFAILPSGRYGHSTSYIQNLAREHGLLVVANEQTQLRKEKGSWIIGELFLLTKA